MSFESYFVLFSIIFTFILLIFSNKPTYYIMFSLVMVFGLFNIVNINTIFSGFSNHAVITIAAMFVVSAGIHHSGGTSLFVSYLLKNTSSFKHAMCQLFLPILPLSAFLNNTPIVSALIPAVQLWSKNIGISSSKLMIPLSYAAILGGTITLIGTSTNLVVNSQYEKITGNSFGLFDISIIGIPVAILGFLFIYFFGNKLLPNYNKETFVNFKSFTFEMKVLNNCSIINKSILSSGLRELQNVYLIEIKRNNNIISAVPSEEIILENDILIFTGNIKDIQSLLHIENLILLQSSQLTTLEEEHPERVLIEAIITDNSDILNLNVKESNFRNRFGAVVISVARDGKQINKNLKDIYFKKGDILLLEARPAFVSRQSYNQDFIILNHLNIQSFNKRKAILSWIILFIAILLTTFNIIPIVYSAILAAGSMLFTQCLSFKQAEKSIDLNVILTIVASFAIGDAVISSGLALSISNFIIDYSFNNPILLLILVYVTISILTEFITNNAAALVILPIVLNTTQQLNLNPEPFVFAIMMSASASFATPIGYQTNLMVYSSGKYSFKDFLKIGIPMNIFIGFSTLFILILLYF